MVALFAVLPIKYLLVYEYYRLIYSIVAATVIYVFSFEAGRISNIFGKDLVAKASSQTLNWYLMHQIVIHAVMIIFDNEWLCFVLTVMVVIFGCYTWNLILKGYQNLVIRR